MEKNTKTLFIVGGVAFASIAAIYIYKSMKPTPPTPSTNVLGGSKGTTTSGKGVTFNVNDALSQIGSWFGLGKSKTPPTTTAFVGTGVINASGRKKKENINGTF